MKAKILSRTRILSLDHALIWEREIAQKWWIVYKILEINLKNFKTSIRNLTGNGLLNYRARYSQYIISLGLELIYLLTPWSRVLLEKLTGSAASQEIPRIFGTRRFITVLTSAHNLSLSWANSLQSSQPPPTSWRSILILSSHLN